MSAFQKVATFEIRGRRKQGGNVAAYFCTPEGRVLHAVAGPVDADTFLSEARWANDTYEVVQLLTPTPAHLRGFFGAAHRERLRREANVSLPEGRLLRPGAVTPEWLGRLLAHNVHLGLGNQDQVHLLLSVAPLPRLERVYGVVFEKILNEPISTNPVGRAARP